MRIWSLHPHYLDAKGLVALWRETLLALAVVEGKTKGYKHHPQLSRFLAHSSPEKLLLFYLVEVLKEARSRGYNFDASKIRSVPKIHPLPVTRGQLLYEWSHLKRKLYKRDRKRFFSLKDIPIPLAHPLFYVVEGPIEEWEKIKPLDSSSVVWQKHIVSAPSIAYHKEHS